MKKLSVSILVAIVGVVVVLQLLPLGRVDNPPVVQEPVWADAQTMHLAERACYDCHSNQTVVPWYGQIAPFSWIVRDHVVEGRHALNFSEMNRPQEEAHEAGEEVAEGEMPPRYYTLLHPQARLTAAERTALAAGLDATLGGEGEHEPDGAATAERGWFDDDDDDDDDDD